MLSGHLCLSLDPSPAYVQAGSVRGVGFASSAPIPRTIHGWVIYACPCLGNNACPCPKGTGLSTHACPCTVHPCVSLPCPPLRVPALSTHACPCQQCRPLDPKERARPPKQVPAPTLEHFKRRSHSAPILVHIKRLSLVWPHIGQRVERLCR